MFIPWWILGFFAIAFIAALVKSVYLTMRIEKLEGIIEQLEGMEEADEDEYEEPPPKKTPRGYDEAGGG